MSLRGTAVIVGFEGNGLGVSRALRSAGIQSHAICMPGAIVAHSTNSTTSHELPRWTKEAAIDALLELASELPARVPLLLTKDEAVLWVSEERERLGQRYLICLPDKDTVDLLMDKERFRLLASSHGWRIPQTWAVASSESLSEQLGEIDFPCILKPAVKNSAFRANSPKKAFKLENTEALVRTYKMVAAWEPEVILQEWIGGGDENIMFCLACYDPDSRPLAFYAGRKLRQWPPECGNTSCAEPAPAAYRDRLVEATKEILSAVNYRGLGSVEFKVDPKTDELVIMEPTVGRTNWQSELAVINGCNLPVIAWSSMTGTARPGEVQVPPTRWIDGRPDYLSAWHYFRRGELKLMEWLRPHFGRKKYIYWRVDDPGPFLATSRFWLVWRAKRLVVAVLRRLGLRPAKPDQA